MASFGRALYYPRISFSNDAWLKSAALYYDGLSRIVPSGVVPHDCRSARYLIDELGFIRDVDPAHEAEPAAEEFLGYVLKYQKDPEYRQRIEHAIRGLDEESASIRIHAAKMSDHLKEELPRLGLAIHLERQKYEHWEEYEFKPVTGAMYMACLANRVATKRSIPLISDHPSYQWLVRGIQDASPHYGDNEDKGYLLGSAVIESAVPADLAAVNIEKIVSFRQKHEGERMRFYNAVAALAKDFPKIENADSLKDCLHHHARTIEEAIKDVRLSLAAVGIACTVGFLGLSVPAWASSQPPLLGIHTVQGGVLTMACGILAREGLNYYKAKQGSPYSYVLSIKRQLRRRFFGQLNEGLHLL